MIHINSADVARTMNVLLKNTYGTTTTEDGAESDGLIVAEDLSNLVDAGELVADNLNAATFTNAATGMIETVGTIFYEYAQKQSPSRFNLQVSVSEFETMVEKTRISAVEFEAMHDYDQSGGSTFEDMFNMHAPQFTVKIWNKQSEYRTKPISISPRQLKSSVKNAAELERLIGMIFDSIRTTYMTALREAEKRMVFAQIANAALYNEGARVIDLLAVYKADKGITLTSETWKNSDDFKRWVLGYFRKIQLLMAEPSGNYNAEQNLIETDGEDFRGLIVEPLDTAIRTVSHMEKSDAFNNVLDSCTVVPFLQNVNEPDKIACVPVEPPVLTLGKHVTRVDFDSVVAAFWDKRGTMFAASAPITAANRNEFDDWTNYIHKFYLREMVDKGDNMIVFVIKDATAATKAYDITEESDA